MVKRFDLSSLGPILHAPAEPQAPPAPSAADLLGVAAGDAPDRSAYFDSETQTRAGGPALIVGGATLMDYRDAAGRRSNRALHVVPPSTAARIATACGGRSDNLNAALIALAEHALADLGRTGRTLIVRSAPDPHRADRIAARRQVIKSRTH
jgi:hypothetical protein